jgi:hypothetical protein
MQAGPKHGLPNALHPVHAIAAAITPGLDLYWPEFLPWLMAREHITNIAGKILRVDTCKAASQSLDLAFRPRNGWALRCADAISSAGGADGSGLVVFSLCRATGLAIWWNGRRTYRTCHTLRRDMQLLGLHRGAHPLSLPPLTGASDVEHRFHD